MTIPSFDWSSLTHAYGPARDVPLTVYTLLSSNAEHRENALYDLFGSVYHQGSIYSASAPAVYLLCDVLSDPECQVAVGVLELLFALSNGYGEPEDRKAIYEALDKHGELFLEQLSSEDPGVRQGAAFVLSASVVEGRDEAMIAAFEKEEDPLTRAALLLNLGCLFPRTEQLAAFFAGPVDEAEQVVALARRLSQVVVQGPQMEQEDIDHLQEVLATGAFPQLQNELSTWWSLAGRDPMDYLGPIWPIWGHLLLPSLLVHLEAATDANRALSFAMALLNMVAGPRGREDAPRVRSFEELSAEERKLFLSICRNESCWVFANMSLAFTDRGFALGYENPRQSLADALGIELD